jgi:TolB protein
MDPEFSPDGKRVVFEQHNLGRAKPKDGRALFAVNLDGSGRTRITPWSLSAGDPDWSRDGQWILFGSNEHLDKKSQLYVIHPDGTGLKQLTHLRQRNLGPRSAFSPDGKWIVFWRRRRRRQCRPLPHARKRYGPTCANADEALGQLA